MRTKIKYICDCKSECYETIQPTFAVIDLNRLNINKCDTNGLKKIFCKPILEPIQELGEEEKKRIEAEKNIYIFSDGENYFAGYRTAQSTYEQSQISADDNEELFNKLKDFFDRAVSIKDSEAQITQLRKPYGAFSINLPVRRNPTKKTFLNNLDLQNKIRTVIGLRGGKVKKQKIWMKVNRIYYIAGMLDRATRASRKGKKSISEYLYEKQFDIEGADYTPNWQKAYKQEKYYRIGLQILQQINPELTFIDPINHYYAEIKSSLHR